MPILLNRREAMVGLAAAALVRPRSGAAQGVAAWEPLRVVVEVPDPIKLADGSGEVSFTAASPTAKRAIDPLRPAPDDPPFSLFGVPDRPAAGQPGLAAWNSSVGRSPFPQVLLQHRSEAARDLPRVSNELGTGLCRPSPEAPAVTHALPLTFDPRLAGARSDNWSGAYVRTIAPATLTSVEGRWRIPGGRPLPQGVASHEDHRYSAWIGLDGHDASSWGMPQLGTSRFAYLETCKRQPERIAITDNLWWQWWIRGGEPAHKRRPQNNIRFEWLSGGEMRLGPGFETEVKIIVAGPTAIDFLVKLWRPAEAVPLRFRFTIGVEIRPTGRAPVGLPTSFGVEGRVAEWIVERPRRAIKQRRHKWLYPLAAFEPLTFTGCTAAMSMGGQRDLRAARWLRMVDWDVPNRLGSLGGTLAAVTARDLATNSFTVTHSGV